MKTDHIYPSLAEFKKLARKGNLIPVGIDIMGDQVTPVALINSHWGQSPYAFLLESVEGGERLGRYSFVSFNPEAILEEEDGFTRIKSPVGMSVRRVPSTGLKTLRQVMRDMRPALVSGVPSFFGGAVGYCSYETVKSLEHLPNTKPDVLGWPRSVFFLTRDLFIFDNTQQLLKIITCARVEPRANLTRIYKDACRRISASMEILKKVRSSQVFSFSQSMTERFPSFKSNMGSAEYQRAVREGKKYIGQGDIIQVVLSRRNYRSTTASPLDIYRSLRVVNPSPYMYVLKMGERAIIGSSPESLVRLENGVASTRPIAGTRPRGKSYDEDAKLERDLLNDPKERAEHIMLVDLGRNDLGRVCQMGSVHVPSFMRVERYSHVMHIVSEVTGRLNSDKTAFDLLEAAFPAGTVSGAPKIRAMEIIDQLEASQRGPYAGALGYISYTGNMDMAITIRTILYDHKQVSIQTGAGIVADSNPAKEFQETENKAAGMKKTIELAESRRLF